MPERMSNMSKVSRLYRVHCPYYNRELTIRVDYAALNLLNASSDQYKKMGYFCDECGGCTCLDEHGACECYYDTPSNP